MGEALCIDELDCRENSRGFAESGPSPGGLWEAKGRGFRKHCLQKEKLSPWVLALFDSQRNTMYVPQVIGYNENVHWNLQIYSRGIPSVTSGPSYNPFLLRLSSMNASTFSLTYRSLHMLPKSVPCRLLSQFNPVPQYFLHITTVLRDVNIINFNFFFYWRLFSSF